VGKKLNAVSKIETPKGEKMKALILALILLATVTASAQVRGRPVPTGVPGLPILPSLTQVSKLTVIRMDQNFWFEVSDASVELNAARKQIRLNLAAKQICGKPAPGHFSCLAIAPSIEVELPIVAKKTDSCGSTVYLAKKDLRPADGSLEIIELTDNRTMTCEIFLAPNRMTEVTYKVQSARGKRLESELTGEAFKAKRVR
jgi:hypothetical protein